MIVTSIPLLSRRAPNEAEVIPFPREETTPPVTNINLVDEFPIFCHTEKIFLRWQYRLSKRR